MPDDSVSDTTSILILGAGELGMPVLRALSRHARVRRDNQDEKFASIRMSVGVS